MGRSGPNFSRPSNCSLKSLPLCWHEAPWRKAMRYDYSSIGFYTFDCLGWPFTSVPEGGGTHFIDELTLAVSGAAGTAAIAAAKMGLKVLAVGGARQQFIHCVL